MRSGPPPTPFGYTIFCDDIRSELGGKFSHMGIYRSKLIVHGTFPAMLPRFCVVVNFTMRPQDIKELENPIDIKIFLPGDSEDTPTAHIPISPEQFQTVPPPETDDPLLTITFNVVLSPLELKEPGYIIVRAFHGEQEWRLGRIEIVQSQQDEHEQHPDDQTANGK